MKDLTQYKPIQQTYLMLKEGQEFKNYKDLCKYLEQPTLSGNSKISQLETFSRHFEFEKEGYKIIITNVYEEPLTEFSKGLYSSLVQKLILDLMARQLNTNVKKLILSNGQLFELLCLVNENYKHGKNNHHHLMELLDVNKLDVKEFYSNSESKLSNMIKRALNGLKIKSLIDYNYTTIICHEDSDGNSQISTATDQERRFILSVQEDMLKHYNCKDLIEVVLKEKWYPFMTDTIKEINLRLEEKEIYTGYNKILYYYKGYDIVFNDSILRERNKLNRFILDNKDEVAEMLNYEIVRNYKEDYLGRKMTPDDVGFIELSEMNRFKAEKIDNRMSKTYVDNGAKLIEHTIKIQK